jgi:type II secretory pathway predicted ATPase ExeA
MLKPNDLPLLGLPVDLSDAAAAQRGQFLHEPPAIEALFQATHGLPRTLNRAAHNVLSAAPPANAQQVSAEHVQAALEELHP